MSGVDRVGVCCCIQVIIFQGEMEIACRIDHFFITNKQIKNTKQKIEGFSLHLGTNIQKVIIA